VELPTNIQIHDVERLEMKKIPKDFWMMDIANSQKQNRFNR
jgi:hypothetical protein